MKKLIFLVALVLLLASPMRANSQWTVGSKVFDVDTLVFPHMVGPGVIFAKYDLPAMPLKVSVMEMDLTNKYVDFETCKGGDKGVAEENPLSMATRNNRPGHEVIGATNGDFYFFQNTLETVFHEADSSNSTSASPILWVVLALCSTTNAALTSTVWTSTVLSPTRAKVTVCTR